jgi:myotubularin-related protein 9
MKINPGLTLLCYIVGIGRRGYIIDTRSANIAKLAQAKGGGVEPEAHYSQWRKVHQGVDRHTALHEALTKLLDGKYIRGWIDTLHYTKH